MNYNDITRFDPRLSEYINKKRYYTKNNITPCIPLETEYAITHDDIVRIRKYSINKMSDVPIKFSQEITQFPVHPPNIQYKNKLHYNKVEKGMNYEKLKHEPNFKHIIDYADKETLLPPFLSAHIHQNKSNRVYNDNNPNVCVNTIREQYHSNNKMDSEILTDLMLGMPSHTNKTYGFNDCFEHSFDYIDNDIQEPDHVVLPFPRGGISARLENKTQTKRDIIQ